MEYMFSNAIHLDRTDKTAKTHNEFEVSVSSSDNSASNFKSFVFVLFCFLLSLSNEGIQLLMTSGSSGVNWECLVYRKITRL